MIVELPTFESFTVTLIVTTIRTLVESAPTILGGIAFAAWLRTQATPEKVKTIFRGEGVQGSLRTVLVGMSLPVCAIGVLPVLRELRRLGLPTCKLITLGLAAPLLNPFSLVFGLTVLSFSQFLLMVGVTVALAIVAGDISSRFAVRHEVTAAPRPAGLTGGTRLRNLLIASSRLATGRTLIDLGITIVIATLTLSLIRYGTFIELCEASNRSGPAVASLLTFTQYVSPSRAIIQFAGIRDANLLTATGLAIYVFGTGVAGASIFAFSRWYGLRRMLALTIALFIVVNSVSYFMSNALPAPFGEVAETNAVDNLARPPYSTFDNIGMACKDLSPFLDTYMYVSCAAMVLLALGGLYVRLAKKGFLDDDAEAALQSSGRMSRAMSTSQLGAVAICGLAVFLCIFTYLFFPGPDDAMEVMERYQVDARIEVQSGNVNAAIDRIAAWDSTAANVPIGAAIRGSFPTPLQQKLTRTLRSELRSVREFLSAGDLNSANTRLSVIKPLLAETKAAFEGSNE